jgi:hypothetical protein
VDASEILPGVWRWEVPHPEWTPEDAEDGGWEEIVASYLVEDPEGPVLLDPLIPDDGWPFVDDAVARADAAPRILLTLFWHARSSREIAARHEGTRVWAHEPAADLVRERAPLTDTYRPGDPLPAGIEAIDAGRAYEALLWLPKHRALVPGDTFLGGGEGVRLCPDSWLVRIDPEAFRAGLRERLGGLPIENVLLTHGRAVVGDARAAVDRALAG